MSNPRFQVGQMVVVHGLEDWPNLNGYVATISHMEFGMGIRIPRQERRNGWWYWLKPEPDETGFAFPEECLRPFDPPASWDHEDSVWKPEALKETEEALD